MGILSYLKGFRAVSIIGTGKESGKTTTCNYILSEAPEGLRLGVTSFGLGGVQTPLRIPRDSLVALAKNCEIANKLELLEETNAHTPWGSVIIGRAKETLQATIAGPLCLKDLKEVRDKLSSLGCDLIIVDGVLNKKSLSSHRACDCFILALGIDDFDQDLLWEGIQSQVEVLTIPVSASIPPSFDKHYALVQEKWIPFSMNEENLDLIRKAEEIFWPGAFTEKSLEFLEGWNSGLTVTVEEPWQIFLSVYNWRSLKQNGWVFKSCFQSPLVLVTLNAHSGSQFSLNPRECLDKVSQILSPLSVVDLKLNE